MRIAFVGKGGSGKTTLSALFSVFQKNQGVPVLMLDADVNMHLTALVGCEPVPQERHISAPRNALSIKTYLRGANERIRLSHFRKTTPPTRQSNFVALHHPADPILSTHAVGTPQFRLLTVGSYEADAAGSSCYHNNLAIAENILSHLIDARGVLVADMVAGVDAFANTLFAQFDLLVLVVEPTRRGVEVYNQYQKLAEGTGVAHLLKVVGNKVRSPQDEQFLRSAIPTERLVGFLKDSAYLRLKDQTGGALDVRELETENQELLSVIAKLLEQQKPRHAERLAQLYHLHRAYVAQDFIRERFGDLADQIDPEFSYEEIIERLCP